MINPAIYDIAFNNLVRWNIRKKKRKPKVLALLYACIKPIQVIHLEFLRYRIAKLYQLKITPQKCYLEMLLRDRWDFTLRRIYIDDGVEKPPFYIYQNAELKPKFIYRKSEGKPPQYIYTTAESTYLVDDFVIYVPLDVVFDVAEMTSLVKSFKLAGTKFTIQTF